MSKYFGILCLLVLSMSCKKKVLEIIPVIEIEKDMSITNGKDIKYFSFPSSQIGYAAYDTSFIYKTNNSGTTWSLINVANNKKCNGLEFFNELKGICLMGNSMYATSDGGLTWNLKDSGVNFIGKTDKGIGILGKCNNFSCSIYTSVDSAGSFQSVGDITFQGDFLSARIVDSKIIVFSKDYDKLKGFDVISNQNFSIKFYINNNNPFDIYLSGSTGCVVGVGGDIKEDRFGVGYSRAYFNHSYNYYSVDGVGNFIVCVGNKTIASNMDIGNDNEWNEVFDSKGNGFDHIFYKIRFINSSSFYLSGNNGLLLKAKI